MKFYPPQATPEGNKKRANVNISEVLANLSSVQEMTTEALSTRDILEIVNVLENISPEKLLENTTQHNRDQFAKVVHESGFSRDRGEGGA